MSATRGCYREGCVPHLTRHLIWLWWHASAWCCMIPAQVLLNTHHLICYEEKKSLPGTTLADVPEVA